MPLTFKIPKALAHLAPILEWFNNIPDGELNEDLDLTYVDSVLRSHYEKLELDDADEAMEADRQALGDLVDAHGQKNPWLYFFQANLTPHILPHLLEQDSKNESEEPPPLTLHVSLPENLQVIHDYGSVMANNSSVDVALIPTAESVLDFKLQNLRHQANHWAEFCERQKSQVRIEHSFDEIDWGVVGGWKATKEQRLPTAHRGITYLLKVPGGACIAEVDCKDADFDESQLEKSFRTIVVEAAAS